MPLCGFNLQILLGFAYMTKGLYRQAKKRAEKEAISLDDALDKELKEVSALLVRAEELYYELLPQVGMEKAIEKFLKQLVSE
jgi:hypothetical protein